MWIKVVMVVICVAVAKLCYEPDCTRYPTFPPDNK